MKHENLKNREHQGERKYTVNDLVRILEKEPIKSVSLGELLRPNGYAQSIARSLSVKRVQLRKVYSEFKGIFSLSKATGGLKEEALTKLYMLYPIIEYQKSRGVISQDFANLMTAIAENIERNPDRENLEVAEMFLTALVAYSRDK